VAIVYISHFLEECQRICDRFTVLRDGQTVGTGEMGNTRLMELVRLMVGRDMTEIYPKTPRTRGKAVLELRELRGVKKPRAVNLTLHAGEIMGIAGLVGAGRTETVRVCFGLDKMAGGTVLVDGVGSTVATPHRRLNDGIGLLSENRKEEGLMLNRSVMENLTLTRLKPFSRGGFVNTSKQRQAVEAWLQRLQVRVRTPEQPIRELSGGNQQKIALARLLHHEARIFLLDEPTRGIDVGSKAEVYRLMGQLAAEGKVVLFISSYLPELLGVCDSIAVMCRGVLSAVRPATEWTEHSLISAAVGADYTSNE
jgi:ribose transport system ATP-binding protein